MIESASRSPFQRGLDPLTLPTSPIVRPVMGTIKLALFDVDGTLRNAAGVISPAVKEAIHRLQQRGCLVALASGRPVFSARSLMQEIGVNAPSILLSGAAVVSPTGALLSSTSILPADAKSLILKARELNINCEAITLTHFFVERESELLSIHASYHPQPSTRVDDLLDLLGKSPIFKFSLIIDPSHQGKELAAIRDSLPQLRFAAAQGAAHPHLSFVNVTSATVSPASALEIILEQTNSTAQEVIAFGDGESDIPLLSRAGIAVAMGNANDSVKRVATVITSDVEEDGVAVAINALLPFFV